MNIPFIRFFKKDKAEEGSVAVAPPPVASTEKPTSERLGKTVMPNSSRIVGLESIGNFPTPPPGQSPAQSAPVSTRKISLGGSGSVAVGPKIPANEPATERTITLPMADLVPGIPSELLKMPVDAERPVVLKAAEVERGMATGRPTVLLRAVYKQVPEFFTDEVPAADLREVALPFTKVVEQFARFQVRDDQITDQECPQVETPFLQVTIEDNKRFEKPAPPTGKDFPAPRSETVGDARPQAVAATASIKQATATLKPGAPISFSPPADTPAPATTDKSPVSPNQPTVAAAPKPSAPIRFSPPADTAAPATIEKTPVSPNQPAVAATPKPSAPIRFSPPADTPAPATAEKAPVSPNQPPTVAATPKPSAPIRFSPPADTPAPATTEKAPVSPNQPPTVAATPKPSAPVQLSAPTLAGAPGSAPTDKAPLPLDQSPESPSTTAKISPNGTGAPAAERVPASSGSPVPTPLSSPLAPMQPTRIPFKVGPPSNDLRSESKFPSARANPDAPDFSSSGPRISLPLRNILRNIAPFQLSGSIEGVTEAAQIEIPFSVVQPQLSLGRVVISPAQFQAALPEEYRALFKADAAGTPVPLLLQDVLQNLPSESLQLRGDQEEPEETSAFETPFSKKASEDAARMKVSAVPIAKTITTEAAAALEAATAKSAPKPAVVAEPAAQPAPTPTELTTQAAVTLPGEVPLRSTETAPAKLAKETPKSAPVSSEEIIPATKRAAKTPPTDGPTRRTALQNLLDTDEPLDAKTVLVHVSRLPGVSSCAIVFSDGLSLAGNIPADHEADALCATAPSIMKRISEQMLSAKFGALCAVTLYCSKTPVTLFAHGNICLAALHSGDEIAAEVRDQLGRTAQELARMYAA